jgi:hypothetical protein
MEQVLEQHMELVLEQVELPILSQRPLVKTFWSF